MAINYHELRQEYHSKRQSIYGLGRIWPVIAILAMFLVILAGYAWSEEIYEGYTVDQWANAIHKAEGNNNYGILSIKCKKGEECRKICKKTIHNNYKRWKRAKSSLTYLQFLGSRYAPIGTSARPVGNDPRWLNKNWQSNVAYWLKKG